MNGASLGGPLAGWEQGYCDPLAGAALKPAVVNAYHLRGGLIYMVGELLTGVAAGAVWRFVLGAADGPAASSAFLDSCGAAHLEELSMEHSMRSPTNDSIERVRIRGDLVETIKSSEGPE